MTQTVDRAMEILRFLSEKPRSLGEVASCLEVHKSTALRALQSLETAGFVRRPTKGTFDIGFGLISIGHRALQKMDAPTIAHPYLERLAFRCAQTVHFAQLSETSVIYIDKVEGHGPIAGGSKIGIPAPLHTAAVSKVILAYQPEPAILKILDTAIFQSYTANTIVTPSLLREQLEVTRKRGWAEDDGEYEDFLNCIALPIFDATGSVTHGMSVTALKAIADLDSLRKQLPLFKQTATDISRAMGWTG